MLSCKTFGLTLALSCAAMAVWAGPVKVSERFGYDPVDATTNLQAALDSGLPEIFVDAKETPWIVNPLFARSNQRIVFEPGTVLLAKRGSYRGRNDRIFTIRDCTNVVVVGNGAVMRMWREDYAHGKDGDGRDYRRGEWRHGLAINGSQRITVDGLVLEGSGGDGIYISEGNSLARDIVVRNCICDRHHRQALSIISGINVLIENCVFKNTKGVPPEDGVDIEPNDASGHCVNIVVRNCVSENNFGNGFEAALSTLRTGEPVSVRFENCRSTGDLYGAKICTGVNPQEGNYPTGSVVYDHCSFVKTRAQAIEVRQVPPQAFEVRFDDCRFEEIGTAIPDTPLIVMIPMFDGDPQPALPKMKNLFWPDRGDRRLFACDMLDFAKLGVEALAARPVNFASVRVVDPAPGEYETFKPVAMRHFGKYYFYADRARTIRFAAKQQCVGPVGRKATAGKTPVERVGVTIADPAGKVVFENPSVLYAEHYLTPRAERDGVWEVRLDLPQVGYPEDSRYELAGVQPLFFLSREKYWFGTDSVDGRQGQ